MELQQVQRQSAEILALYHGLERKIHGSEWTVEEDALAFDDALEKLEKKHLPSQEEFYIMSHAFLE